MVKTPLEDFTTEILAGILMGNKEIGDAFVNRILKIEGNDFSFNTQEHFNSINPEHPDCRVDLVIRSEKTNMICFVECKVESREGYIQLDRYSSVLDSHLPNSSTYLKYCTKYFDSKDRNNHEFHQFRWADVYRFLCEWQSSDIIKDFLEFLNEHDMSDNMDFTITDLMTLQGLNPIIKKMSRYLEKIRPILGKFFDQNHIKSLDNLKEIKTNSRLILNIEKIFGESGYSEIGVGFDFSKKPELQVWIWIDDEHSKYDHDQFIVALTETDLDNNGDSWLGCTTPLSDFISSDNMEEEIERWFSNAFQKIKDFVLKNPGLNWKI